MGCGLSREEIQKAIDFHGHWCPGLAIGIRASEWALEEMGRAGDEDVVAVVETDMCAVDAIQRLVGCTFGKGNLIHLDHGKTAFTFHRRGDGKSARLVFDADRLGGGPREEYAALSQRMLRGELTPEEETAVRRFREEWSRRIMEADLDQVFQVKEAGEMPTKARILVSLVCEACGERAMESRTHRLMGQTLCRPCFERLEKRI